MEKLITQKEIEDKYKVDLTTVRIAMSIADVKRKGKTNEKRPRGLWDEKEIVDALNMLFMKRALGYRKMALMWWDKADRIHDIYEGREWEDDGEDVQRTEGS